MRVAANEGQEVMAKLNNEDVIKVGDGATMHYGSDCYPYTIVGVSKSGKRVFIQRDEYEPAENFDYFNNQIYNYTPNPDAPIEKVSLRKTSQWKTVGGGTRVSLGVRRAYQDPSF